jgi:hypothetical protein
MNHSSGDEMKTGDLLIFSDNLVDTPILGIVIEIIFNHVVVAGLGDHGVRTYSMDVIKNFATVSK